MSTTKGVVVANFNVHAGIDGWGRPYDVVAACLAIDADVLVVEESWDPDGDGESITTSVARGGGYTLTEVSAGAAYRVTPPSPDLTTKRWGPRRGPKRVRPIRLEGVAKTRRAAMTEHEARRATSRGKWMLAVLSRLPVRSEELIPLPPLRRDPASRTAIALEVDVAGKSLCVVGVHFAHLAQGSPIQMRALHRYVQTRGMPAVVVGDLNSWGPPLRLTMPGLRDAVRGPTWPAWRPHSRIDHILCTPSIAVEESSVLPAAGSDHRAIRARISITGEPRRAGLT